MEATSDAVYVRGHKLFLNYLQRNGLGHLEVFFNADMTLGQLRELNYEELVTKYTAMTLTDREKLAALVHKFPNSHNFSVNISKTVC